VPVRVVLVDDAPEQRAALREALVRRGGFQVVAEAEGGVGAIDACGVHQPDVVVLDLGLPDLAGRDVLTRVRSACPRVRIVVSGGTPTLAGAGVHEPVDAVVEAHPDVGYLAELLAQLLGEGGGSGERTAAVALPGRPSDVATARQLVHRRCTAWGCGGPASDDASAVVSELVSNAVLHAGTGCVLSLRFRPPTLRLEVEDLGPGMPDVQFTGIGDEHGRGLLLVNALCAAWGAEPAPGGGKRVWAELCVPTGAAAGGPSEERQAG
jgi:CheY-like chemotaxis protein/anti-sigma regulatory factor (Ser/Thr protein kinase)